MNTKNKTPNEALSEPLQQCSVSCRFIMEEDKKCPKCLAYYGHHPECPLIDFDTAKKMLAEYYRTWLDMEMKHRKYANGLYERIKKGKKDAEFWKGKFNTVKIENNALRRKLSKNGS